MERRIKNHNLYSISTIILTILTIISLSLLILLIVRPNKNIKAASTTYDITIDKISTVSVYISGPGVTLKETNNNVNVYSVEENTEITLRAVNESKIFESWNFLDESNTSVSVGGISLTNPLVTFTPTQNMKVKTIRRDARIDDYGKYMYDRFIISDAVGLVHLQNILEDGSTKTIVASDLEKYNYFFENCNAYPHVNDDKGTTSSNLNTKRLEFLNQKTSSDTNVVFEWIQNGYFLVSTHLTIFGSNSSTTYETYDFKGIGNINSPFKGVFCGSNDDEISRLIVVISRNQETNYRYGLFGYLAKEALVRNLEIATSIGITSTQTSINSIYAGGLAGEMENAIISNVKLSTNLGIDAKNATIYAGGIAGKTNEVVFDNVNGFSYDGAKSEIHVSATSSTDINVGMYAGCAVDTNVSYANVDTTSLYINVINNSSNAFPNSYVGGLFGRLEVSKDVRLENINLKANKKEHIVSTTNIGNNYVGGLVGYISSTQTATVNIGKVNRINTDTTQSEIIANSYAESSKVNLYSAGLFAYIDANNGLNVVAKDSFKQGITQKIVQDKTIYEYNYLFDGNYKIQSLQKGLANDSATYGKAVTGGVVGKGLFKINGTNSKRSDIVFSSQESKIVIESTQSSSSKHEAYSGGNFNVSVSDIEHSIAGIFTALVSTSSFDYEFEYINFYVNNVEMSAIRETASRSMGDVIVGGFIGFANDTQFDNINLYLNGGEINGYGMSYEVRNQNSDTNNLFCGGFIGKFEGTANNSKATMNEVKITGLDYQNKADIGTTVKINSIQNTKPGGDNYMGENYIGGVVGRIERVKFITNTHFEGSKKITDGILMQGQESPDSAFCGGLIGFIKNNTAYGANNGSEILISNCKVTDTSIHGLATDKVVYHNPDIYIGGLIGAMYSAGIPYNNLKIEKCQVRSCQVTSEAKERLQSYAGGIIGATTWNGDMICTIENTYVYDTIITATANYSTSDQNIAWAAGICASNTNVQLTVQNCGVIDSSIYTKSNNNNSVASSIANRYTGNNLIVNNCFSNSSVYAEGSGLVSYNAISYSPASLSNCYFVDNNLPSGYVSDGQGHKITLSTVEFTSLNESKYVFQSTDNTYVVNGNLHYPILEIKNEGFENDGVNIKFIGPDENSSYTDKVNMWVKINSNGVSTNETPDDYATLEQKHSAGWFNLGQIAVYYKNYVIADTNVINDFELSYLDKDSNTYKYKEKVDGANYLENVITKQTIKTNYEETISVTSIGTYEVLKDVLVNLHDDLETLQIKFTTPKEILPLKMIFLDESLNIISDVKLDNSNSGLGIFNMQQSIVDEVRQYTIHYNPNNILTSSKTFYLGFQTTSGTTTIKKIIKFQLEIDRINLVGAQISEFTPPINYLEALEDSEVGTSAVKPFYVRANSTIMIYASIQMLHNLYGEVISNAYNASYVTFAATNSWEILSNGALISGSSGTTCAVTITLDSDSSQTKTIYFESVTEYLVSESIEGGTFDGVVRAGSGIDYKAKLLVNSSYSGNPKQLIITIGSNTYNLLELSSETIRVLNSKGENIFRDGKYNWSIDEDSYTIIVPYNLIDNDININVKFVNLYRITLNIQCDQFNPTSTVERQKVFELEAGTLYRDFFGKLVNDEYVLKDEYNTSMSVTSENSLYKTWISKASKKGFIFKDFYLITIANSVASYGVSFKEIALSNIPINSSLEFYARWSFLIEVVEAPGTHIKTSFSDSYMMDITEDEYGELVTRTIQIPINNNRGYIFTIEKDEYFVGDVGVEAYVIAGEDSNDILEIEIENYSENANIYYISPDKITGYLVITTTVSNSQVIIGENTASVTEEILPEDGIYTFKYIVNHQKGTESGNPSYIYNSGKEGNADSNLKLTKDFLLEFKQQSYDNDTNHTSIINRSLTVGTTIMVYYQKIVDNVTKSKVVGTYTALSPITSVKLSEFTLLDESTKAFKEETFEELLSDGENVTETYYFVITPPNGDDTNVKNEILNYIILGGYIDESTESGYAEGIRTELDFANRPIDGTLDDYIRKESSCCSKIYSVTPSRTTVLSKDADQFTFVDDKTFEIYEVNTNNCVFDEGYQVLKLLKNSMNGEVISSQIKFGINRIYLTLGYEMGEVTIYGSNDEITWEAIDTVMVDSVEYKEYRVDFETSYKYFKIVNQSYEEICLKEIKIISASNGMTYTKVFDNTNYNDNHNIQGDLRHDGKSFILAVQLKDSFGIMEDIGDIAWLKLSDGTIINPLETGVVGRNTLYFNLSASLLEKDVNTITFTIEINGENITVYAVQLLEVSSTQKPAMGEVRYSFNSIA